ncbi:MAG: gluconokinase [Rhodothermales bacterium]|nr:gluconokinase [Rhodothermales bacterium]
METKVGLTSDEVCIGVDIGTTSTKAVAIDRAGRVRGRREVGYPLLTPDDATAEQDPIAIRDAAFEVLRELVASLTEAPIRGLSFSSAMHSLIALDADGSPLTPCITWADTRSRRQADALRGTPAGDSVYAATGTPIHPMTPLCKLIWLREDHPDLHRRAHRFVSIKEFVLHALTGELAADASLASATGLFDIRTRQWHAGALALAGIDAGRLAPPVPTRHRIPALLPAAAAAIGLPIDTPVIVGASDGCLANLGVDALEPGRLAVTIGTSGAVRIATQRADFDTASGLFSYILDETTYIQGGPINNGGIVYQWFAERFPGGSPLDMDTLLREAGTLPAGADGLLCLPYLLGERAPYWNARARGVYFGISIQHTLAHFLRAALEGVIFTLYAIAERLAANAPPVTALHATGGFVHSPLWTQILADVFGQPVHLLATGDASALGACILGWEAVGEPIPREALDALFAVDRVCQPDAERHAVYTDRYRAFDTLYRRLDASFADLLR